MQSQVTQMIIATVSAIFGGAIALGFGNAEAQQPAGSRQIQFVLTGQASAPDDREGQGKVERWEDPEYGIVCYVRPTGRLVARKSRV